MSVLPADDAESATVALHRREKSGTGYWGHPGICTVTFCEGDAQAAFAALKPRLRAVVDANAWIAGQLVAKARCGMYGRFIFLHSF